MCSRKWSRYLPITALAALGLGSTCETQDVSEPTRLRLESGQPSATLAFEHPYVGRLSLDFALRNPSNEVAIYDVAAQAQTRGDAFATACEEIASNEPRQISAARGVDSNGDTNDDVPVIRTLGRVHLAETDEGTAFSRIDLRIRDAGVYRLVSSVPGVVVTDSDGTAVAPTTSPSASGCEGAEWAVFYSFSDGTYRLVWEGGDLTALVERDCADVRTVPRTCPGSSEDVLVRDPIVVQPGETHVGRIGAGELGVGDTAVVSLACNVLTPECAGELEVFLVVSQLECTSDGDCRSAEACDDSGYCVPDQSGGCRVSTGAGSLNSVWVLWLLLVLTQRRRR